MISKTGKFVGMIVALSMLTVGFAFSAGAQIKDNSNDKKEDYEDQVTYVNTDNGFVACLPAGVDTPSGVTVNDPVTGNQILQEPLPATTVGLEEPKHDNAVCLGGAVFSDTDPSGLWKLWAQEEIHHQVGGASCAPGGDKVLCPSGLAQIRSSYTFNDPNAPTPSPTCEPDTATKVCVNPDGPSQDADTLTIHWTTHKTVFCNDLQIDLDESVLDSDNAADEFPGIARSDFTGQSNHDVVLFFSGPNFVFDCFGEASGLVKDAYRGAISTVNSVTCNSGNSLPNLICIHPDLFLDPACAGEDAERTATIATVGTVSYDFVGTADGNEHFCTKEDYVHDAAFAFQETQPVVTVENVPVVIE